MALVDRSWWQQRASDGLRKAMALTEEEEQQMMQDQIWRSQRNTNKKKMTPISTNIYRAPVANFDDAVAIGIINLTMAEAEVLKALARQIQDKRSATTSQVGVAVSWVNENFDLSARTNANPDWKPEVYRGEPPLQSWRMGELNMGAFRDSYGVMPPGWMKSYNVQDGVPEFISPNNQRFRYDRNSNSLRPYPNGFVCANGHPLDSGTAWCEECTRQQKAGTLNLVPTAVQAPAPEPKAANAVEDRFSGLDIQ